MATTIPAALAIHKDAPYSGRDGDKDKCDLAGTVVRVPTCFVDSQLLLLGCESAIGCAADGGNGPLCTGNGGVSGEPADVADINVHEPVEHVPGPTGIVEWDHVGGVVEEDVGEVASALVDSCWLAFEYPVLTWGPGSGSVELEAGTTVECHAMDQFFSTNVIAD